MLDQAPHTTKSRDARCLRDILKFEGREWVILFYFVSSGGFLYFYISCVLLWQGNLLKELQYFQPYWAGILGYWILALLANVLPYCAVYVTGIRGNWEWSFPLNTAITEQEKILMTQALLSVGDQKLTGIQVWASTFSYRLCSDDKYSQNCKGLRYLQEMLYK